MADSPKNKSKDYEQMEDLFKYMYESLNKSKLSGSMKDKIVDEIGKLKSFTVDARAPRIALVGRRGSGKSSLINAIFGEYKAEVGDIKSKTGRGTWYTYEGELGEMEILDTRGLGESEAPDEETSAADPVSEVKASIKEKCPDVILFLAKAKEVGARIDEDAVQLLDLKKEVNTIHDYDVPVIGVVTQVDELAPLSDSTPPFSSPRKQENIESSVEMLGDKLEEIVSTPIKVIPVCSYMEFDNGKIVYDLRWNVDVLVDYLVKELPTEAQVILAKLSKIKSVQKKLARKIGKGVAGVTGIVGASPIPGSDMPIITSLQISMVGSIAMIGGTKINKRKIIDFIGALGVNAGVGFALREVARQAVKIFPGAGSVISGSLATAGTYALCEAAIKYFIDYRSADEAKKTFEKELDAKREELG
ncbi:50S ribosome-binding GTPase [Evansella sp. LMS18]|uniref:GTPase family protein n=1 Tax=Evansella sp. LMS18 TaxID=2924033 RepID=UPI0020D04543|nr:GTPase [Evansella sp. LMS18]UTR12822.1 50S ribosome-binding GTPase [Evansella sp. LMS18]